MIVKKEIDLSTKRMELRDVTQTFGEALKKYRTSRGEPAEGLERNLWEWKETLKTQMGDHPIRTTSLGLGLVAGFTVGVVALLKGE